VPANLTEETSAAAWPAPTPDLVEAAEPVAEEADEAASAAIAGAVAPLAEPDAVAEEAAAPEAPVKERRRAPRKTVERNARALCKALCNNDNAKTVAPAKAGAQVVSLVAAHRTWVPAFAGTT
jgi:hypothetical protein